MKFEDISLQHILELRKKADVVFSNPDDFTVDEMDKILDEYNSIINICQIDVFGENVNWNNNAY